MANKIYKFHIVTFESGTEFGDDSFIRAHSKIHAWHSIFHDGYIESQIEMSSEVLTHLDFVEIRQGDGTIIEIELMPNCSVQIENAGAIDMNMADEAIDGYWGGGFSNDSDTAMATLYRGEVIRGISRIYAWEVGNQVFMVRVEHVGYSIPTQHITTDFISRELWETELVTLQKEGWVKQ